MPLLTNQKNQVFLSILKCVAMPGFLKLGPAEFSSNPDQTHVSKLIKVFGITRKSQVSVFDQDWS